MEQPRVIIVMGVAGSGKSTVGAHLAAATGGRFFDADDFHPPANIRKMAAGTPLDDADREPWLRRLREEVIVPAIAGNLTTVLACSALKKSYRRTLGIGTPGVTLVHLQGEVSLLADRLASRTGHYMPASMLESQLAILEEPRPDEGITVGIDSGVENIVGRILGALGLECEQGAPLLHRTHHPTSNPPDR